MLEPAPPKGSDLAKGIALDQLQDGIPVEGHFQAEPVLLVRRGQDVLAIGARCSHYGAPLEEGLAVGETVRCPWHHACFSLRNGEALGAPALDAVDCFQVERRGNKVVVTGKRSPVAAPAPVFAPSSVVIIGTGAAGSAAAEMLRREGYAGPITLVGSDPEVPYDRPNLSKDYLAGNAPEEWIPLRSRDFYREKRIELRTSTRVTGIDVKTRKVVLEGGETLPFGTLLLATGAQPRRLPIPGAELGHVLTLRSLADSRALIERAKTAKRAVVIGAGFIGLEVAASLRARGLEVHIAAPDARPLERILGAELAEMIQTIHESHGVVFHLGKKPTAIDPTHVTLSNGELLAADVVVIGAGVAPETDLAEKAGLELDHGVKVNQYLETSAAGIYAAGDIARYPDPHTGASIRVEHWAVAQRQGQAAARNMLGGSVRFDDVPIFWSAHFDVTIAYVGHAEGWDRIHVDGDAKARDCRVEYWKGGKRLAVATVNRDRDSLQVEAEMQAAAQLGS
jgi:NADPH-dependent 2,4-dienoyl-CoA reductase/sulfur reductase-like enzyme/nitrite reductase/ring-hydroxylating ferredoxin subunit